MRRYKLGAACVFASAAFVVAWVNAQERLRPRVTYSSEPTPAPARLDSSFDDAKPLELTPPDSGSMSNYGSPADVMPVAGDSDQEEYKTARRTWGNNRSTTKSSSPPATSRSILGAPKPLTKSNPSTPPQLTPPPATIPRDVETEAPAPLAEVEGVSSVLKKKEAAASESRSESQPRLTPTTVDTEPAASSPTVSSRRIGSPSTKAPSIRGSAPVNPPGASSTTKPSDIKNNSTASQIQLHGESPHLIVDAVGPKAVTVGKSAIYTIQAVNNAPVNAQQVEIRIGLPTWVQLDGGEGTRGEARQENDPSGRQWLIWSIAEFAGKAKEQLVLNLTPIQNQPFELSLQWTHKPAVIASEVTVNEPELDLRLEGPSDMLFGEQKNFTLHIHNPGTGDAENVFVEVTSGGGAPNRLPVGYLMSGERKELPFTVNAVAPGEMEIRTVAQGAGNITAQATSRVLIRRAELQVAIGAPTVKFAGGEVTYEVAVANVGDATAEQVTLSVALPQGAKYIGGLDGAATAGDALSVKVGNLTPNTEKVFDVRCILLQAGENRFQVTVQGKGDLAVTDAAVTNVEALADLKLSVQEPTGPLPVGSDATYEVRVVNRGTKAAHNVQVVVQFAQGLEPNEATGGKAEVADGQAIFESLKEIGPGKELVFKVKSKVEVSGSHAFRVEVKANDPDTKLVSEGVTRCFAESMGTTRATARKPGSPAPTQQR